jgi:hypothetical protein
MSKAHYWGVPEFAQAEDLPEVPNVAVGKQDSAVKSAELENWAIAARYYWAAAYAAMTQKKFSLMREQAKIAAQCEYAASPEAALMMAIFGSGKTAPERAVQIGQKVPVDESTQAKACVKAEMEKFSNRGKK